MEKSAFSDALLSFSDQVEWKKDETHNLSMPLTAWGNPFCPLSHVVLNGVVVALTRRVLNCGLLPPSSTQNWLKEWKFHSRGGHRRRTTNHQIAWIDGGKCFAEAIGEEAGTKYGPSNREDWRWSLHAGGYREVARIETRGLSDRCRADPMAIGRRSWSMINERGDGGFAGGGIPCTAYWGSEVSVNHHAIQSK